MAMMDGDMILIFIVGGMFSLLLVGSMLVYIRCHQRGIDTADRDESLHDQIDQLMLARTTLDKDHQSGCISDSDYATCLDIDRRLLGLGPSIGKRRCIRAERPDIYLASCWTGHNPAIRRGAHLCRFGPS